METWAFLYGIRPLVGWQVSSAWTRNSSRHRAFLLCMGRTFCFFPRTGWKRNVPAIVGWPAHSKMESTSSEQIAMAASEVCSLAAEAACLTRMAQFRPILMTARALSTVKLLCVARAMNAVGLLYRRANAHGRWMT